MKFYLFIGKSNFHREHPRYADFNFITIFPHDTISAWKKSAWKILFLAENTLYMILDQKKFPQKFLKMAYYSPRKVIWGQTSFSNEILECQGVVTK